jgi:glutaconate CoA-transferase subunit B
MQPATNEEVMAVLLAKDLRPEDRMIIVGANMPAARAAAIYASLTSHPHAHVMIGMGWQTFGDGRPGLPVYPFTFDPRTLAADSWMHQSYFFDDMHYPDLFFVGGMQVDQRGNVNLFGIPDDADGWAVRGPGGIGTSTLTTHAGGYYIVMLRHDRRTFVERVSLITALGDHTARAEARLPGGGPRLVVSPLGVFGFDETGNMNVRSLHRRVTPDDLRAATGFTLEIPDDVRETTPITDAELRFLRERVDPEGILRRPPD